MANPLVSLCVPTYNRVEALRQGLPSIVGQAYSPLEILISDNGSTDGTEAFCREAAARDPRIRYLRQPRNLGLYANHNALLEASRGEWISFCHDHDARRRDLVPAYVAFFQRHPTVGVVCADWELIDEHGQVLGVRASRVPLVTPGVEYIGRTIRSGRSSIGTPGAMVRRAALGAVRFDEAGPIGFGDFPVWFQVAERADVGHLPQRLWQWRQHPCSQSARSIESWVDDYEQSVGRYCDRYGAQGAAQARRAARWRRAMQRYLFWALAFEVGLHCRPQAGRAARRRDGTTIAEWLNYRLSPEAFERALAKLRRLQVGAAERAAYRAIGLCLARRWTAPLAWATYRSDVFRRLLRLA